LVKFSMLESKGQVKETTIRVVLRIDNHDSRKIKELVLIYNQGS
jgi:hypothetical protein